jgi:hypothetical protein
MSDDRDVVAHLADCFDAAYQALGELAPLLSFDSYVVCVHEMSRSFGEVALSMREYTGRSAKPLGIVDAVLRQSWREDQSGALTLYTVAVLVGPRLLVSVRDALELVSDARARELCDQAQLVTVRLLRQVGDLPEPPVAPDAPQWQGAARDLAALVESSGNADSFGTSR